MDNRARCQNCQELLECNYCYVCDGDEPKRDQIHIDLYGECFELHKFISYVEMGEDTYAHLYE